MNELALFAGAGGGILGGKLLGWRTVCAVEWEPYPASVLCARQNDGILPPFPIWDDVQTFDGRPWRGIVDVVSGGFPCQDISAAGKGAGIDGERSGMWGEMARIIREVRPKYVFVENSPMLTSRGLGRVLGDLASMGFDARWGVLGAADVGAPHQRDRIWIVGKIPNTNNRRCKPQNKSCPTEKTNNKTFCDGSTQQMANTSLSGFPPCNDTPPRPQKQSLEKQSWRSSNEFGKTKHWWEIEPNVGRVADGVAARVDRLKAIGNGQVPLCAATAWRILNDKE
ncbi:MAG: DNA cytosine methyltransferase [Cytophagia bacterium]|nr:DNA cytosine methyltransferase [Cytophagia bacterium]